MNARAIRILTVVAVVMSLATFPAHAAQGDTTRVSVGPGGIQANDWSYDAAVSADGRYVAFDSKATNLVASDTNGKADVFVYDRVAQTTEVASVATGGAQANYSSGSPAISADGRYVAFRSSAWNLDPADPSSDNDIYVRDRIAGTTTLASVSAAGVKGDGDSTLPSISADGRHVTFNSRATNLVAGDTNNQTDIFARDLDVGTTELISVSTTGVQGNDLSWQPATSGDGKIVAFVSYASNLIPSTIYGVTGDANSAQDIYVRDRTAHTTTRVSVSDTGAEANAFSLDVHISANGRFVCFDSNASNLVANDKNLAPDVFVYDRVTAKQQRVSVTTNGAEATGGASEDSAISANGRFVTFESWAKNLAPNDTNGDDIFVYDRATGIQSRVLNTAGQQSNGESFNPTVSDTAVAAFESQARNLVADDTNAMQDLFTSEIVADLTPPAAPVITSPAAGSTTSKSTKFIGTAEAGSTVRLYKGTTLIGTGTTTPTGSWYAFASAFTEGSNTVTATATDKPGNIGAASAPLTIDVDAGIPVSTITSPASGAIITPADDGLTVTGTAKDNRGVSKIIVKYTDQNTGAKITTTAVCEGGCATGPNVLVSWTDSPALSPGQYTVAANTVDAAGNIGVSRLIGFIFV